MYVCILASKGDTSRLFSLLGGWDTPLLTEYELQGSTIFKESVTIDASLEFDSVMAFVTIALQILKK